MAPSTSPAMPMASTSRTTYGRWRPSGPARSAPTAVAATPTSAPMNSAGVRLGRSIGSAGGGEVAAPGPREPLARGRDPTHRVGDATWVERLGMLAARDLGEQCGRAVELARFREQLDQTEPASRLRDRRLHHALDELGGASRVAS